MVRIGAGIGSTGTGQVRRGVITGASRAVGVGNGAGGADVRLVANAPRAGAVFNALKKLRGIVLLGGAVRQAPLSAAIQRAMLDLPVERDRSVLDCWRDQVSSLTRFLGLRQLPIRVVLDRAAVEPVVPVASDQVVVSVERDPVEYRGTGGVLRDLAVAYDSDDYLIVASAAQVLIEPLPVLVDELAADEADISLMANQDGTPAGMMLIRCGALKSIPAQGFIDLKEQALRHIAAQHHVRVSNRAEPGALPLRTLSDYVRALCKYHAGFGAGRLDDVPFELHCDWRQTFSVVESGSLVDPTSRIHDSVVLRGSRVDRDAVLVRSVVCPGATVRRGQMVVDQVVSRGRIGRNAKVDA